MKRERRALFTITIVEMVQSQIDQRQYMLLFSLELNPSPALDYPGLASSASSEHRPVRGVVGG